LKNLDGGQQNISHSPAVVPTPLRGAGTRVRSCAKATVFASLGAKGNPAVVAGPIRGTAARVRAGAVSAVAASLRADGSRAVRVEPTWLAVARVRECARSTVLTCLHAQSGIAGGPRVPGDASARGRGHAHFPVAAGCAADGDRAVNTLPAGSALADVWTGARSHIFAHEAASRTHSTNCVVVSVGYEEKVGVTVKRIVSGGGNSVWV